VPETADTAMPYRITNLTPHRRPLRAVATLIAAVASFLGLSSTFGKTATDAETTQRGGVGYVELQPATLKAFERYQSLTGERIAREIAPGGTFLYPDSLAPTERDAAYASLLLGTTRIEQLQSLDHGTQIACPGGIIHHWLGIIFVPGATLDRTLQVVQNYKRQTEIYSPQVVQSRVISHSGDDYKIFLRLKQLNVITVVLDTEHDVHYTQLDASREASKSISTSVREVANAGKSTEHELAPDTGGGYLWRINTYWRFLQRDSGVYVQCESISLSRDIPTGLGWIVGPFVTSIPRESLSFTLGAMRKALTSN
jgi:hypothetical protein